MPPPRRASALWLIASEDALRDIDKNLRRQGVSVRRVVALDFQDESRGRLRARLCKFGTFDTLIVTSRHAIAAFVRPVLRPAERRRREVEAWAAGPATARSLAKLGFPTVRRANSQGAAAVGRALARGARRSIVYARSDRAGPLLARGLRRRGHRVLDLVAYRTTTRRPSARELKRLVRSSGPVVVTSPSALSALRAALPSSSFRTWRRRANMIAWGERTLRSVRGHGFREARAVPSLSVEGLTAYLAREARDAST